MPETKQGPASAAPAAATTEPLAAILAEMREAGRSDEHADGPLIEDYADRIEAAAERERNAHTNDIHDALYKATGIPGNAAALREALMKAKLYFDHRGEGTNLDDARMAIDAIISIDAAFAAPARNCDRFATEDEARDAYWAYREPLEFNNKPFVAITEWLFVPAEGGKE